jgi:DNA-binding GntR family transcriptional regulator
VKAGRLLLREHVREVVLERILNGEYAPGERLVETKLAREFDTSQVPVREALRELEMLRFVESEPFRGARVRAVTRAEMLEIFPVRSSLEELAAREAARRLDGDVSGLERALAGMIDAAAGGDVHEQVTHDVEFHRVLVEGAGNSILREVWFSLRVEARTLVTALHTGIDLDAVAAIHEPILAAVRERDPAAAAAAMADHFRFLSDLLEAEQP